MKSKGKWPNSLTKLIQQVIQQNVKNDDNLKKNTDFFFKDRTIITLFWYIKHTQTHTHMQSLLKIINNSRYIFFSVTSLHLWERKYFPFAFDVTLQL